MNSSSEQILEEIADDTIILLRQIHPMFHQHGRPSKSSFKPTSSDDGMLSVSDKSIISAKEAFRMHTEVRGKKSAGVYGVTVEEVNQQGLKAYSNPSSLGPAEAELLDDAHAVIDFNGFTNGEIKEKAIVLSNLSADRGAQYLPPVENG